MEAEMNVPRWVTVKEAARMLGIPYKRCYELIHSGYLPAYRIGERAIRLRVDQIEAHLERHRV